MTGPDSVETRSREIVGRIANLGDQYAERAPPDLREPNFAVRIPDGRARFQPAPTMARTIGSAS
jgi:hypothetical protein